MNTMLLVSGLLLLLSVAGLAAASWCLRATDYGSGWEIIGILVGCASICALLFSFGIPINTYVGRAYGRVECRNWGHQTGRPVRFVTYTSWSTGECLTRDNHGRWISKDQLRQFAEGR